MFCDLIPAGYTEVDSAFANEGGDVGGREEDESYRVILDQGDVETGLATKLYIGACEEVKGGLLETSLCSGGSE